ncbi:hypothetical protein [Prevotella sp. tf2-5]|uniref:hypothetical protein n=1 Tax=Prevotella sp. tf2-5 TaxID=1761889 RepID=UPI0015A6C953|nr:hypothetical protein [Prevotella sp. tf2-5]
MSGLDMNSLETSFVLNINPMNEERKDKLNRVASNYRSHNRSILTDMGNSMITGGVAAIINIIGTEIINLTQIRSRQKKAWEQMRQKECMFVDSLQSVKGQSDFYGRQSTYGPLDPSDMNFDGITLKANRGGKEVLKMVCHIDTMKFDHLFLHSKFYLVVDTIIFHPYRSFLPNLKANHIEKPRANEASQDEIDYWNTISQFSFEEHQSPIVNIQMEIYSSWINELVQVYQDVKLGSFSVNIPINERDLTDSVYIYSRKQAIAENRPIINMDGDCFVVPRSYMPVAANNPSWGTGEYKMKVVLSEKCRYNPKAGRSKNWHRDYKQLVRMRNHGKAKNEYLNDVVTTFRDNGTTILKATYTPVLNALPGMLGIGASSGGGASKAGAGGASKAGAGGASQAQGGASGASGAPAAKSSMQSKR